MSHIVDRPRVPRTPKPESATQVYDIVVVGGGHNGLAAGCYLARAGYSVVVIEKEPRLGGMAMSAPLIPEAPGHLVSPCAFEDLFFRIAGVADELNLRAHGFREHESAGWMWLATDGDSLWIQRDVERTVADIARFSKTDARRYREFMQVAFKCVDIFYGYLTSHPTRADKRALLSWLRTLATDRKLRTTLAEMLTSSAVDAIAGTFESEAVRSIFANTILGCPFADGNGFTLMNTTLLHRSGIGRPVGGMGGIIAALDRCLHSLGGESRVDTKVAEITTESGEACGVVLDSGEEIAARVGVIAACPPQAVPGLVGAALDDRIADQLRGAPDDAWGIGQLTVTLALTEQVDLPLHAGRRIDIDVRRPTLMAGTFESIIAAARCSMLGKVPDVLPWWATIFNAIDPTQAPEGQDVIDLYSPMVPSSPQGGWGAARDGTARRLVDQAAAILSPRLNAIEIGRYIETPADRAERVGTGNGCIYHIDFLPTRVGPLRPALGVGQYRTPIRGLYLSGVGTHPPAGVSGLNGKLSAEALMRDVTARSPVKRSIRWPGQAARR